MDPEEPTNEENEEAPESSLRDDLEAAIEVHENDDESEGDGEGEDTPAVETPKSKEGEEKPDGTIGDGAGDKVPDGINAPLGFSPEEREAWKNVPPVVQQKIAAREQEMADTMANTGEARRTHTAITNLAQSYAPILAAEGAETPMAAVEGLFKTVAELRMGTPQQSATKMAQLISHYGIDITMLDSALSGQPMASPEETRMAQLLDERLAPFQDMMNNQNENANHQYQASQDAVNGELAAFAATPEAEFLNDVREDMADLIDMASKRGVSMSFEDAYAKACSIHPQISGVLAKRAADANLVAGGKRDANKQNASSSLRAGHGNSAPAASDGTMRGDIIAAMESME